MKAKIIGDCRDVLPTLKPNSVQTCVTSPPFWGLRDYDHDKQIGCESSPVEYVSELVAIFELLKPLLCSDGTVWLNLGDAYARNGGVGKCGPNAMVGNTKKLIQKRNCRVPDCWGLKDRDLFGLPWRVAFAMQQAGWLLRSAVTWIKATPMPESVRNRPSNATEMIFLFSVGKSYFYDATAVREASGANLRNYWMLKNDSKRRRTKHTAIFPMSLPLRCIALTTREGDTVIDPFSGSGTTADAAEQLKRKSISIDCQNFD